MNDLADTQSIFPRTRWALVWIIGFFALQILFGMIAVLIAFPEARGIGEIVAILGDVSRSGPANIYGAAVAGFMIVAMLVPYLGRKGRIAAVGLDHWSRLSFAKTLGAGFLLILSAGLITHLYSTYAAPGTPLQAQTRQLIASMSSDWLNQIILFLVIVVFAAIIEEVLFRGLLQNGLKRRVGPYWAIVLAGLIFAAVHMQPLAFPVLAVIGMAFGYLYHLTGSLRVTISLHMINNAAALLLT